jgi:ABC-2 type transport system permease protein
MLGVSDVNIGFAFAVVGTFAVMAYAYAMHLLNSGTRLRQ